jgi:glycosyltransferase involved in cell wall biosynthesis
MSSSLDPRDAAPSAATRVSVIVPTMNRPDSLRRALDSILSQTRRPDEVVVVDDGESDEAALRGILQGSGTRLVYVKKDRRGICRSRNEGVRASSGDILVFIDDDVVMQPGYIEGFLRIFASDTAGRIGGLTGRIRRFKNGVPLPEEHRLTWEDRIGRLFLFSPSRGGIVLPSGFRRSVLWPIGRVPVEFLQGGNMAVRREVFEFGSFDENLDHQGGGYSLGEDVQFSYPMRKRWIMLAVEDATCEHWHAQGGRPDPFRMARMRVIHTWGFVRRVMDPGPLHRAAFAWAVLGLSITSLLGMAFPPRAAAAARLRGTLAGVLHVLTHRATEVAEARGILAPRGATHDR